MVYLVWQQRARLIQRMIHCIVVVFAYGKLNSLFLLLSSSSSSSSSNNSQNIWTMFISWKAQFWNLHQLPLSTLSNQIFTNASVTHLWFISMLFNIWPKWNEIGHVGMQWSSTSYKLTDSTSVSTLCHSTATTMTSSQANDYGTWLGAFVTVISAYKYSHLLTYLLTKWQLP